MITSLRMVNFKNFVDETLRLGPFTVIVGANASGKSNIRDAFRFLHGVGRGYTLAEIMGGKYGPGGQLEWEGIRGAPNEVVRFEQRYPYEVSSFAVQLALDVSGEPGSYTLKVEYNPSLGFRVVEEKLETESSTLCKTVDHTTVASPEADQYHWVWRAHPPTPDSSIGGLSRSQPAVTQFLREHWNSDLLQTLGYMQFLDLNPAKMREPSIPGVTRLGASGENLSSALMAIFRQPQGKRDLLSWLQELSPMDVADMEFPRDPSGRVHLHIIERSGRKVSAYSASDGTLRFLGLLAVLFGEHQTGLYFFEEIDNGLHPNRLWLLLDLIERQTAKGEMQVITTTHSPALLSWLRDETFEHTSLVYRDEYWADSVIRPVADLYNLRELRKSVALGELHTEGWFEQAMKSKEGDYDTDHLEENDEEGDVRETDG